MNVEDLKKEIISKIPFNHDYCDDLIIYCDCLLDICLEDSDFHISVDYNSVNNFGFIAIKSRDLQYFPLEGNFKNKTEFFEKSLEILNFIFKNENYRRNIGEMITRDWRSCL